MKILFITMEIPYPDNTGGRKITWQKIRQLSEYNDIYLLSINEKNEEIVEEEYKKYFSSYSFFNREKNWLKIILQFYKPYSMTSRINSNMRKKIKRILIENSIDLIILDSIHLYYNIKSLNTDIPIVLNQHNIEYKLFKSIANKTTNKIKKLIYNIESCKIKKIEKKLYNKKVFKGYIFISNVELKKYEEEIGKIDAICIPPAVEKNKNNAKNNANENIISFFGKMSYEPNITAVKWFTENIFTLILKDIPDAKFYIIGKDPSEEVLNLRTENIIVTGMVDKIEPYIENSKVIVIPLLSGAGVKLKLFEALSYGKIVVSTSKGIEGTCFKDKVDLYVEDSEKEFADRCIENLRNPNLNIGITGLETLNKNYGFDSMKNQLQNFINKLLQR